MGLILVGIMMMLMVVAWTWALRGESHLRYRIIKDMIGSGIVTTVISTITILILWLSFGLTTTGSVNKMTTFLIVNDEYFIDARERLYQGVPKSLPDGDGPSYIFFDSANYHQILPYARNVVDTRDQFVKYNNDLTSHLYWQRSFLVGMFWKNLPDNMKYITVADSITIEKRIQILVDREKGLTSSP